MNVRTSPDDLAAMQFGIGQPVKRQEDPILVRGEGSYTDDVSLPGQLYAAFVRSPYRARRAEGHRFRRCQGDARRRRVYTAADLAPMGYGPLKCVARASFKTGMARR